jgi:hypothetical protein
MPEQRFFFIHFFSYTLASKARHPLNEITSTKPEEVMKKETLKELLLLLS